MTALPALEAFFTDRLMRQRRVSPETVCTYRDSYPVSPPTTWAAALDLADIDSTAVAAFLQHLESDRHNSVRTPNVWLSAIHSLFRYAALRHPEHAATISRVLTMPPEHFDRALVSFLTAGEFEALLTAPDPRTWTGHHDRAPMLLTRTRPRISELIRLRRSDVHLGAGAHVTCRGKVRKDHITPLGTPTIEVLRRWLAEYQGGLDDPLFPTRTGSPLSRDATEHRSSKHHGTAARKCLLLNVKRVTAHALRHTAAMRLLEAGVDTTVIALWPGHGHVDTTAIYPHAHLGIKEQALAPHHTAPCPARPLSSARPAFSVARSALIMPTFPARSPPPPAVSPAKSA